MKLTANSIGWFVALISSRDAVGAPRVGTDLWTHPASKFAQEPWSCPVEELRAGSVTVEAEYAFKMAKDFTPGLAYTEVAVLEAISSVVPMLEFVDSVFEDMTAVDVASLVADNGADGQIVLGQEIEGLSPVKLLTDPTHVAVNGVRIRGGPSLERDGRSPPGADLVCQ